MKCERCNGSGCIACDWRGTTHDDHPQGEYTCGGSYTPDTGAGALATPGPFTKPVYAESGVDVLAPPKSAPGPLGTVDEVLAGDTSLRRIATPTHLVLEPKASFENPCGECGGQRGHFSHCSQFRGLNKPESAGVRTFSTGANRSAAADKPDYEGFLSPLALVRFGEYMHKHRKLPDGSLRDSDNWQKGIPIAEYVKSLWRHLVSVWLLHRQGKDFTDEQEDNLCAIIFNAQGKLHEILKARQAAIPAVGQIRFFKMRSGFLIVSRYPGDLGQYFYKDSTSLLSSGGPAAVAFALSEGLEELSRAEAEDFIGYPIRISL